MAAETGPNVEAAVSSCAPIVKPSGSVQLERFADQLQLLDSRCGPAHASQASRPMGRAVSNAIATLCKQHDDHRVATDPPCVAADLMQSSVDSEAASPPPCTVLQHTIAQDADTKRESSLHHSSVEGPLADSMRTLCDSL